MSSGQQIPPSGSRLPAAATWQTAARRGIISFPNILISAGILSRGKTKIDPVPIRQLEVLPIHVHPIGVLLQRITMPAPAKDRISHDRRPPTVIPLRRDTMRLRQRQIVYKNGR